MKCAVCENEFFGVEQGIDPWEWDYCSVKCFKKTEEFKKVMDFYESLNVTQQYDLDQLLQTLDEMDNHLFWYIHNKDKI